MFIPPLDAGDLKTLLAAVRQYIASTDIAGLLAEGVDSILEEGQYSEDMETPVIIVSTIGDGLTESGQGTRLLRLIVYVVDRGRGYYEIEKILPRLRKTLKSRELWEFLTFPPDTGFAVLDVDAPGSTASTTLPAFSAEARGVYVFATLLYFDEDQE